MLTLWLTPRMKDVVMEGAGKGDVRVMQCGMVMRGHGTTMCGILGCASACVASCGARRLCTDNIHADNKVPSRPL